MHISVRHGYTTWRHQPVSQSAQLTQTVWSSVVLAKRRPVGRAKTLGKARRGQRVSERGKLIGRHDWQELNDGFMPARNRRPDQSIDRQWTWSGFNDLLLVISETIFRGYDDPNSSIELVVNSPRELLISQSSPHHVTVTCIQDNGNVNK